MTLLSFVVLGVIMVLILGRAVTPQSKKKPVWQWKLDDYGDTLRRGVVLILDAGARSRWRMDNLQKQADYSERGRMDGDRLPTDHAPHPREQMPPGAMPPHRRPPEGQPLFRPDDWVGAGTEDDHTDDAPQDRDDTNEHMNRDDTNDDHTNDDDPNRDDDSNGAPRTD